MSAEQREYPTQIFWPVVETVGALLAWEALVRWLGVRSIILPPPSEILYVMGTRYQLLLNHLWPSLYMTVVGFLLSVVGGIFVAILITYSRIVRLALYPLIVVSQVIPKISIAPLFIVWFGTGMLSSLMLAFLIAFFPMTINAAMGFKSVDIHKMARAFSLAAAVGHKLFPAEEAKLITELVRRDLPFYDSSISEHAVACLNRFARAVGLLDGNRGHLIAE